MQSISNSSLPHRIRNLVVSLGTALLFVYVVLPLLTRSSDTLSTMSDLLDTSGIDPTSYYYTDVEQVWEAERYIESALHSE